MADDPKQPAKTLLGWLPNVQPGTPQPQPSAEQLAWDQQQPQAYAPAQGYSQQPPPLYPQMQPHQGQPQGFGPAQPYDPQGRGAQGQAPSAAQQSYAPPRIGGPQSYGAVPQGYGQAPQSYGFPTYGAGAPQGSTPQGVSAPMPPTSPMRNDGMGAPHVAAAPQSFGQAPSQGHGQPPTSNDGRAHVTGGQSFGQAPHSGYPQRSQAAAGQGYPPSGYPPGPSGYPQAPSGFAGYGQAATAAAVSYASGADSAQRPIPNAHATVGVSDRVRFIRLTYLHLLGAILTFAGLLYLLMTNETLIVKVSAPLVQFAFGGRWHWGVVLGAFMVVSWVADYWASHATSRAMQYAGLGIYVLAEALIFVPLLALVAEATYRILARGGHEPHIIRDAALTTLAIFGALTASVLISKKDFSWMRSGLVMLSAAAMMLVVLSLIFGFNLGIVFSIAMVVLAAGYILYQTSQVLAHYDPRQHVAAALALFSSVALMFWYVIRIFLRMRQ
jgi:FtsH-binding integral membrane protein